MTKMIPSKIPFLLLCLLVLITACDAHTDSEQTLSYPNETTDSLPSKNEITYSFEINPIEIPILAKRAGTIETILPERSVQKNDLLIQFNNREAFSRLTEQKVNLKKELSERFASVPEALKKVQTKWLDYANSISESNLLPKSPELEYKEEADILMSFNYFNNSEAIVQLEQGMQSYFILAPQAGRFKPNQLKAGVRIEKGETIGSIEDTEFIWVDVSCSTPQKTDNWNAFLKTSNQFQNEDFELVSFVEILANNKGRFKAKRKKLETV